MRSEKRIEVIILELSLQRLEANPLYDHVAEGVGEDLFFNSIAPLNTGVRQLIKRNARLARTMFERAVTLFFRKEATTIGDDESLITRASLVHSWKVNLIQNPMAQCEPDAAIP